MAMAISRRDWIEEAIAEGDVEILLRLAEGGPCACSGAVDGELLCRCAMTSKQVREAVSYAALKRGVLLRLARPPAQTIG